MNEATYGIRISADARGVASTFNEVAGSGDKAADAIRKIGHYGSALIGLSGGVQVLRQLAQTADSYAGISARLSIASKSAEEYKAAQAGVYALAQSSLAPLAETAQMYTRLHSAVRNLNGEQQQTLRISEAVTRSLRISGAAQSEQAAAILQFAQAMGSGRLQGDEFRSLMETAPRLMQAIAEGVGVNVGQLKSMATAGQLTADVIGNALLGQLSKLREESAQIPKSISGAWTTVENAFTRYIGQTNQVMGVSKALASVMGLVAENMRAIGDVTTAGVFLALSAGAGRAVASVTQLAGSVLAQRSATIAATQAELQATAATLAHAQATQPAIAAARADYVVKLEKANADIASAKASMAAAEAAGAQSAAYRAATLAAEALTTAEARRSVALAELALLGQQQARASAQLAAAQTAQAAASIAAATASSTATGAMAATGTVLSRVLGLLGGPVGLVATLGIAGAAWFAFGRNAEQAVEGIEERIKRMRAEAASGVAASPAGAGASIAALGAQVTNLQNKRDQPGISEGYAKTLDTQIAQLKELQTLEAARLVRQTGGSPGESAMLTPPVMSIAEVTKDLKTRTGILREYAKDSVDINRAFGAEMAKAIETGNPARVKDLAKEMLEAHKAIRRTRDDGLKGIAGDEDKKKLEMAEYRLKHQSEGAQRLADEQVELNEWVDQQERDRLEGMAKMRRDLAESEARELIQRDEVLYAISEARSKREVEKNRKIEEETVRQAKRIEEEDKRRADGIERELTGALMRGFESGKSASKVFWETMKNMARSVILEPLIKPMVQPIAQMGSQIAKESGGFLGGIFKDLFGGGRNGAETGTGSWFGASNDPSLLGQGVDLGIFEYASGGVMTSRGPLPLRRYAGGGVAASPQMAMYGEGSMPEAYVPLPDGRSIPVTMEGGGGSSLVYSPTININAPGADSGVEQRIRASFGAMLAENQKVVAGLVERQANRHGRRLGLST